MKILAVYLSPSRPLIGADLDVCFGGGLPVLMAGDLNAKHVDWNSRLSTRGKLLRDYADSKSCLIFGPDSPTTNPYKPSATPDVLDIVITRDLHSPIDLTSCSALSSTRNCSIVWISMHVLGTLQRHHRGPGAFHTPTSSTR